MNVVVILADDLGWGDLSSYGASDLETPHIDGLMAAGVRFDRFYSNSPVCSPTRAALLTGMYPDRVGVPGVIRTHPENSWGYLSPKAALLPEPLQRAGFHTALVGKWHLGLASPNTPNERGFDEFRGFLGDMMDDYYDHRRHGNNYMRRNGEEVDPKGHATDIFTDWAVEYLKARRKDGKKFFLYLAYNAPHTPIQPPPEWLDRVRRRRAGLDEKREKLAALIEHMDASIGRVIGALKDNGQYEDTLIVFTSDNGGQLDAGANCGNLRGGKQDMYEGGIRVPMCAVWPGRIAAGTRTDIAALTMDLFPTICEAAGAATPEGLDGVAIAGWGQPPMSTRDIGDSPREWPERDLVWVRREGGMRYQGQEYYALRRGKWKLLQNSPFEPFELYDLFADPLERANQASREPKLYRELIGALMRHVQRAGRTPWQGPEAAGGAR